jgi:dimethylaniline monooxygenase (N-oxide forming)
MNTSKEMMAFSDFPPPASYPTFMCHERVLKYYRAYAEHFDLIRHVRFGTMVTKVEKSDDYEQTERWKVHAVQMRYEPQKSIILFDF